MIAADAPVFVVWYKKDLRIDDHAPLFHAAKLGLVLPLFIFEQQLWTQPDASARQWSFVYDSLMDLDKNLRSKNSFLTFLNREAIEAFDIILKMTGKFTLISHEETGNDWSYQRDKAVAKWCQQHQVEWLEWPNHGVVRKLKTRDEWAQIRNERMQQPILDPPPSINTVNLGISDPLIPKNNTFLARFGEKTIQPGGRTNGLKLLESFLNHRSTRYLQTISKPHSSSYYSSRLSPHICYGTVSIKEIEQAVVHKISHLYQTTKENSSAIRNLEAFLSRLAWRCHFVQKLEQEPEIEYRCMHRDFEGMREGSFNEQWFNHWKNGTTGYPLIDACMRALKLNGWINFRMRAMLVSFASYQLWLDFRKTAPYLAQLFTDYEPGIHYSQFQMQSGTTGINTIRIYNPVKQSQDQDPEGLFIRKYVPELQQIPKEWIHTPWLMPEELQKKYHTIIGLDYPFPIVEHDQALKTARSKLSMVLKKDSFKVKAEKVYNKHGSRKRSKTVQSDLQLELDFKKI